MTPAPVWPRNRTATADFILANTELLRPPHVPEVRLHLASEINDLWYKTEEELGEIGLPPPFWAFAWAGGQGLARFVLDHPETVRGRRIVDFACGSGLVGIAAALSGALAVHGIDTDPVSGTAATLNAHENGVTITFRSDDIVGRTIACDTILAGDVFYDRRLAERLLPWFCQLSQAGIEILVGDPGRAYLPRAHLRELAVYRVPTTRELEDCEVKRTAVWRFA